MSLETTKARFLEEYQTREQLAKTAAGWFLAANNMKHNNEQLQAEYETLLTVLIHSLAGTLPEEVREALIERFGSVADIEAIGAQQVTRLLADLSGRQAISDKGRQQVRARHDQPGGNTERRAEAIALFKSGDYAGRGGKARWQRDIERWGISKRTSEKWVKVTNK